MHRFPTPTSARSLSVNIAQVDAALSSDAPCDLGESRQRLCFSRSRSRAAMPTTFLAFLGLIERVCRHGSCATPAAPRRMTGPKSALVNRGRRKTSFGFGPLHDGALSSLNFG